MNLEFVPAKNVTFGPIPGGYRIGIPPQCSATDMASIIRFQLQGKIIVEVIE